MSKSLLSKLKAVKTQLGICPITGISVTIDIPSLPIIFEYPNPLSIPHNAKNIFSIEYKEASKLSNSILAGSLLSLLSHYELIQDKLSGIERNAILSEIPPYYIWKFGAFLVSLSSRKINLLPHLSLNLYEESYSSPLDVIQNYYEACTSAIEENPPYPIIKKEDRISLSKNKKQKNNINKEKREEARFLLKSFLSSFSVSPKFSSLLKLIVKDDNLITLHKELRDRIVKKLEETENEFAEDLALVISSFEKSLSQADKYKIQEDREILNSVSDSFVPLRTRKSLKEILAEKQGKKLESPEGISPETSIIKEEQEEQEEKQEESLSYVELDLIQEMKQIEQELREENEEDKENKDDDYDTF